MKTILNTSLASNQAALWFLGQSGFIIKSCNRTVVIDPYLSNSVAEVSPRLTRLYPPPLLPSELKADVYIVTHDHLDHLDPKTLAGYQYRDTTTFVAPRLASEKLRSLGIPSARIVTIDSGQTRTVLDIAISGIYAIGNDPASIDTAGYHLMFANGRSVYHSADTDFSDLLLRCVKPAEMAMVCINGQWGNLNIEQAAELVNRINPRYAVPHHYDLMALNAKDPAIFEYQMNYVNPTVQVKILKVMNPFIWSSNG